MTIPSAQAPVLQPNLVPDEYFQGDIAANLRIVAWENRESLQQFVVVDRAIDREIYIEDLRRRAPALVARRPLGHVLIVVHRRGPLPPR